MANSAWHMEGEAPAEPKPMEGEAPAEPNSAWRMEGEPPGEPNLSKIANGVRR